MSNGQPQTTDVAKREIEAGAPVLSVVPRTLDETWRIASLAVAAGVGGFQKPEQAAVVIMAGLEVGVSPMQALQNIMIVKGRTTVWGDLALGLVRRSGLLADFFEEPITDQGTLRGYRCTARRVGEKREFAQQFTIEDAQRAHLWGKPGPWTEFPQRMLQMRARSWCLRDLFPDVLKGLSIREEVQDVVNGEATVVHGPGQVHAPPQEQPPDDLLKQAMSQTVQNGSAAVHAPEAASPASPSGAAPSQSPAPAAPPASAESPLADYDEAAIVARLSAWDDAADGRETRKLLTHLDIPRLPNTWADLGREKLIAADNWLKAHPIKARQEDSHV